MATINANPNENKTFKEEDLVIVGVPLDHNSSFLRGPAQAPALIRKSLYSDSSNLCTEKGYDLGEIQEWHFLPDIEIEDEKQAFTRVEEHVAGLLKKDLRVISLGGDHSITIPVFRAYAAEYPNLNILHFDAHPDLYDELDENRNSHACPFARIMEKKLAKRLVQVGIRTLNKHQYHQAQRFGTEIITMDNVEEANNLSFDGPVYISLDMDCLDPAFAPGVSHHEPGGMSTRDVLKIIKNVKGTIVGADLVEYNPERDLNGVTGMVAAKLLKEIMARMLEHKNPDTLFREV